MMGLTSRWTLGAAFSAALLLGAAATTHAQEVASGANKIANGNGVTGTPSEGLRTFSFSLVELPNGTLQGQGRMHDQNFDAWVRFDITSYMVVDGILLMAGPITYVAGDDAPPEFFEGSTFFFAVRDGGTGEEAVDEISLANAFPAPGMTIQEVMDLFCSFTPGCDPETLEGLLPPDVVLPITSGNIKVF